MVSLMVEEKRKYRMIICIIRDTTEELRHFVINDGKIKLFVVSYPYPFSSFIHKIRYEYYLPDHTIFFFDDKRICPVFGKYFKIEKKKHANRTYNYIQGKKVLFKFFSEPSCFELLKEKHTRVFLNLKPWIHFSNLLKEKDTDIVVVDKNKMEKILNQMGFKEYEFKEKIDI